MSFGKQVRDLMRQERVYLLDEDWRKDIEDSAEEIHKCVRAGWELPANSHKEHAALEMRILRAASRISAKMGALRIMREEGK